MIWNPADIVPGHLLTVIILSCTATVFLIALFVLILIKANKNKKARLSVVQKVLFKTKFNFEVCPKESEHTRYFVKATYRCFDYFITYYLLVNREKDYLKVAKQEIIRLIKDDTLCIHTLKIISYKEFKQQYETC